MAAFFVVRLADGLGRKPVLVGSLAGYGLLTFATYFAHDLTLYTALQSGARMLMVTQLAIAYVMLSEELPAAPARTCQRRCWVPWRASGAAAPRALPGAVLADTEVGLARALPDRRAAHPARARLPGPGARDPGLHRGRGRAREARHRLPGAGARPASGIRSCADPHRRHGGLLVRRGNFSSRRRHLLLLLLRASNERAWSDADLASWSRPPPCPSPSSATCCLGLADATASGVATRPSLYLALGTLGMALTCYQATNWWVDRGLLGGDPDPERCLGRGQHPHRGALPHARCARPRHRPHQPTFVGQAAASWWRLAVTGMARGGRWAPRARR